MKKIHSFHLPKVTKEEDLSLPHPDHINEYAAQQSLFQISKLEEPRISQCEQFIKELNKHSSNEKRYQKSSLSLPRKREIPQVPPLDLRAFRQTFLPENNLESIGITNFIVIDNRRHSRHHSKELQPKSQRGSLHQQINRKAKYLFRSRNKPKRHSKGEELFLQSFYCTKIQSTAAEQN